MKIPFIGSPHYDDGTGGRAKDTITIHCMAGQLTAAGCGSWFQSQASQCSSNYGVGYDGSIAQYVSESDTAWTSSSGANDRRAITIEVASERYEPYAVTDAAYEALIKLLVDICKRNKKTIPELRWKADEDLIGNVSKQNMTVHRWFANKSCPGNYLYGRHSDIVKRVNAILKGDSSAEEVTFEKSQNGIEPGIFKVLIDDLRIRSAASDTSKVNGTIPKGLYTITEIQNGWGKLKSGRGWIWINNKNYTERQNTVTDTPHISNGNGTTKPEPPANREVPFLVDIKTNTINIHTTPSDKAAILRPTGVGKFTIEEVKDGWGRLKSGAGWINLNSIEPKK